MPSSPCKGGAATKRKRRTRPRTSPFTLPLLSTLLLLLLVLLVCLARPATSTASEGQEEEEVLHLAAPEVAADGGSTGVPQLKLNEKMRFEELGPIIVNRDGTTRCVRVCLSFVYTGACLARLGSI